MTNRRARELAPAIPFIQLYDSGTQTFTTTGEFHTWDTTSFKTSDFHYNVDDDRVQINRQGGGWYEITFESSFTVGAAGFASAGSQVYINGEAVEGSKACGCGYDSGQGSVACACVTLHFIIYLNSKDYIQIKTTNSLGSEDMLTVPETSRLIVKFIPIKGWDNSAGGKVNFRGGVMR